MVDRAPPPLRPGLQSAIIGELLSGCPGISNLLQNCSDVVSVRPGPGLTGDGGTDKLMKRSELIYALNYPVEFVPESVDKTGLAYHVYSERLFFSLMTFTREGLPVVDYPGIGVRWNPAYVAWWALMGATAQALGKDKGGIERLRSGARWLIENAKEGDNSSACWFYSFRWREGRAVLEPPWISSISQGLGISALLRAYRENGDGEYLDTAVRAAVPFSVDIGKGGLRSSFGDAIMYEEYPARPCSRVLDGSVFGLLGLHDLYRRTGDKGHQELFYTGLEGIGKNMEYWNYRDKWSRYGAHRYLCSPMYNKLNSVLMKVLHGITGDDLFRRYAGYWDPENISFFDSVEIRAASFMTLNLLRARLIKTMVVREEK